MVAAAIAGSAVIGAVSSQAAGASASKDAKRAAAAQAAADDKAIAFQRETLDTIRGDLEPYRNLGTNNIDTLQGMVNDPQKKLDYVTNNPFFEALAKKSSDTLLNNQATKGKLASGGTAEALQNSLLLLGNSLVNENISQNQNLVNIGENAAAQTGSATSATGNSVAGLFQDSGNAQAAGLVASANAKTAAAQSSANSLSTGAGLYAQYELCDRNAKENIQKVGMTDKGLPLFLFNYKGDNKKHVNVMAQDVEEFMPAAVIEINGLKHINREMVYGN